MPGKKLQKHLTFLSIHQSLAAEVGEGAWLACTRLANDMQLVGTREELFANLTLIVSSASGGSGNGFCVVLGSNDGYIGGASVD